MTSYDYAVHRLLSANENPYAVTVSADFNDAMITSQCDLDMPIAMAEVIKIETREQFDDDVTWQSEDYFVRIAIMLPNQRGVKYIYTKHLDMCTGMGPVLKLNQDQLSAEVEKILLKNRCISYGNEDEMLPDLHGHVVIYGGGARAAAIVYDIMIGKHPKVTSYVWISKKAESLQRVRNMNRMYQDVFKFAPKHIYVGSIVDVTTISDRQIIVSFKKSAKKSRDKEFQNIEATLLCNHLVVAIGTKPSKVLLDCPTEFQPLHYREESGHSHDRIPVGLISKNRKIAIWAAAAISASIKLPKIVREEFLRESLRHSSTLSAEINSGPMTVWRAEIIIPKMVASLQFTEDFPGELVTPAGIGHYGNAEMNLATKVELMTQIERSLLLNKELFQKDMVEILINLIELYRTNLGETIPYKKMTEFQRMLLTLFTDALARPVEIISAKELALEICQSILDRSKISYFTENVANLIINIRRQLPHGIQSIEELTCLILPRVITEGLREHYFLFGINTCDLDVVVEVEPKLSQEITSIEVLPLPPIYASSPTQAGMLFREIEAKKRHSQLSEIEEIIDETQPTAAEVIGATYLVEKHVEETSRVVVPEIWNVKSFRQ